MPHISCARSFIVRQRSFVRARIPAAKRAPGKIGKGWRNRRIEQRKQAKGRDTATPSLQASGFKAQYSDVERHDPLGGTGTQPDAVRDDWHTCARGFLTHDAMINNLTCFE